MSDYTPDEELVRDYVSGWSAAGSANPAGDAADVLHLIARIKAEALREAADEYATSNREQTHGVTSVLMFMHHRADQIEEEAGQAAALGDDDE